MKQILFKLFWWTYLIRILDYPLGSCKTCPFNGQDCFEDEHISLHVNCKHGFKKRF